MKKNKGKLILIILVIVLLIISVITLLLFGKSTETNLKGNFSIVNSINANTQAEIDNLIKNDLKENKYDLENARVYVNPYGISPLSALIVFKTENKVSVTTTLKGKNNDDITVEYDRNTEHYIPVYGLYSGYENTVQIKLSDGITTEIKIAVDNLEEVPSASVHNSNITKLNTNHFYFVSSPITMSTVAFDVYGELRWMCSEFYYHEIVLLNNGHMLIGTDDFNNDGLNTKILEIDYLGRIYKEYTIDNGYLNSFFVKEDGNIILSSKKENRDTYSDYIVEIDDETGKIVKTWDIYNLFNEIDPSYLSSVPDDYFYNSGIEYYSDTDSLLLTYWGGEFVINLDYTDGNINWIFSNPENFSSSFDKYLLKGLNDFIYPKSMHSASLNENTLKLFDNGYSTILGEINVSKLKGSYSSANTYQINGNNISLVNSFNENKSLFSYALGDYQVEDNHELILFGRELDEINYSLNIDINEYDLLNSRLFENIDGVTVLDMQMNFASLNVLKINMSKKVDFNFIIPDVYTTMEPSKKESVTKEVLKQIESATDTIDYEFGYSNKMIETNIYYMSFEEAKLILVNDFEDGAIYTLKIKDKSGNEKIMTDLPEGRYYVFILENGTMYKTNKYIDIK